MSTTRRSPRTHRFAVLLAMGLPLIYLGGGLVLAPANAAVPEAVITTTTGGRFTLVDGEKLSLSVETLTKVVASCSSDVSDKICFSGNVLTLQYLGSLGGAGGIKSIVFNNPTGPQTISVGSGANSIENAATEPAISVGTSTLVIVGGVNNATLSITGQIVTNGAANSIDIGVPDGNKVTVTVSEGTIPGGVTPVVNSPSELIQPGGPPPGPPEPCINSSISIGGVVVVTNCTIVDPLPTEIAAEVSIEGPLPWAPSFFIIFKAGGSVGPISVTTDAGGTAPGLTISMEGTTAEILADAGYSIVAPDSSVGFTGIFGTEQQFALEGGIQASNVSAGDWSTLQIGSSTTTSTKGIEVSGAVESDKSVIDIWTSATALSVPSPAAWVEGDDRNAPDGYAIRATNEGQINVWASTSAVAGSGDTYPRVMVSHGGSISLAGTSLGNFEEYVSYWNAVEAASAGCLEATDPPNENAVTELIEDGNAAAWGKVTDPSYTLTSKGKPLRNLSWATSGNFYDIVGGSACIKSAFGYLQLAQDFESQDPNAKFVDYWIEEGTTVKVELLPDPSYQFVTGEFTREDGLPVTLSAASLTGPAAMYEFVMPGSTVALDAVFEQHADYVAPATAIQPAVAGGTIDVSAAGFTVPNGNARVTVAGAVPDTAVEDSFVESVPTGFDDGTLTFVDLGLDSIILAGNEETGWTSEVTLGATPTVGITIALGADLKGYTDYTVLHEIDPGNVEELAVTQYNTATGEITFATSSFSTFAILHTGVRLPSGSGGNAIADTPIAGADRFGTAAAISQEAFPYSGVPMVYVTSGLNFPDALAASAAAVHGGGPVLLATPEGIPAATAGELTRLKPGAITVLGGTASVSDSVFDALQAYTSGSVTRVAGADRYATAIQSAQAFTATGGTVFLATGTDFPDALSAGTLLSSYPGPILLVRPGAGLSAGVKAELARLAPTRVFVLGGTSSISAQAASDASALASQVIRLAGADRYATSAAIANWVIDNTGITGGVFGTTGKNFPDGLTAGVLTAQRNGAIVLANGTCWSTDAVTLFGRMGASTARLIGGSAAMAPSLAMLNSCAP